MLWADKRIENRSWSPPAWLIGGYLLLHAGGGWDAAMWRKLYAGEFGPAARNVPPKITHAQGCIVGIARLVGWHAYQDGSRNVWELGGTYGRCCWDLEDVRPFLAVKTKGGQRLWKPSAPVLAEVFRRVPDLAA